MAAAHVPDEIIEALDKIAEQRGVERTKVIRWALIEYIDHFFLTVCPADSPVSPKADHICEKTHA